MVARNLAAALALLVAAACGKSPGALGDAELKFADVRVVNLDAGDAVPAGYRQLRSLAGDNLGSNLNKDLWADTVPAQRVVLAYRTEVTEVPLGIADLHVDSSDAAAAAEIHGAAGHDAVYGAANPGCTVSAVDLNASACRSAQVSRVVDIFSCTLYPDHWEATCHAPATPLTLHYVLQKRDQNAIRCIAVGDVFSYDVNRPPEVRRAHVWWGPEDANRDGAVDAADADFVLANVTWLRQADGQPLNLNRGTQSYRRLNQALCAWLDAWIHPPDDLIDAQYLGVCPPLPKVTPPPP